MASPRRVTVFRLAGGGSLRFVANSLASRIRRSISSALANCCCLLCGSLSVCARSRSVRRPDSTCAHCSRTCLARLIFAFPRCSSSTESGLVALLAELLPLRCRHPRAARFPRDDRGHLARFPPVLAALNRRAERRDALAGQGASRTVVELFLEQRGGQRVLRGAAERLIDLRREHFAAAQADLDF